MTAELCPKCSAQLYENSTICRGCSRRTDPAIRFNMRYSVADNGCWEWSGGKLPRGYGLFFTGSKKVLAHRWSYEHFKGPIPNGLQIDHLCRNTACVNPEHLEAVTNRENTMRGLVGQITHCRNGHLYDSENTLYEKDGHRRCKTCTYARNRESRLRKKDLLRR